MYVAVGKKNAEVISQATCNQDKLRVSKVLDSDIFLLNEKDRRRSYKVSFWAMKNFFQGSPFEFGGGDIKGQEVRPRSFLTNSNVSWTFCGLCL